MAKYVPTQEHQRVVELMAAGGIPLASIAGAIGIGLKQLGRSYGKIIRTAKDRANAKVVGSLFNQAMKGNVTACIFWLKTQAGWLEAEHKHKAQERDALIEAEIARVALHGLKALEPSEMAELRRLLVKVGAMQLAPAANDTTVKAAA